MDVQIRQIFQIFDHGQARLMSHVRTIDMGSEKLQPLSLPVSVAMSVSPEHVMDERVRLSE